MQRSLCVYVLYFISFYASLDDDDTEITTALSCGTVLAITGLLSKPLQLTNC